jgi:hypothetical protein
MMSVFVSHPLRSLTKHPWKGLYNETRGLHVVYSSPIAIQCHNNNNIISCPLYSECLFPECCFGSITNFYGVSTVVVMQKVYTIIENNNLKLVNDCFDMNTYRM